jgi:hypothetical protein
MQNVETIYADKEQTSTDEQIIDANACWFCDETAADNVWTAEIYLHKLLNTHLGLSGNKYEYLVLKRFIPCCRTCSRRHEKAQKRRRSLMNLGGIVGFIAGFVIPFVIALKLETVPNKDFNIVVVTAMFGGAVLGVILGYLLAHKIASSSSTKPQAYAKQHPVIKPFIEQGWGIGKPE